MGVSPNPRWYKVHNVTHIPFIKEDAETTPRVEIVVESISSGKVHRLSFPVDEALKISHAIDRAFMRPAE